MNLFQQQQIIPQDSTAKPIVQQAKNDSSADTAQKIVVAKPAAAKPKHQTVIEAAPTVTADSLPKKDTVVAEVPVVSLFTGHELKTVNLGAVERVNYSPGWITLLLVGCVVVIAYLRVAYFKRFTEFLRAVMDMRFASQIVRDEKVLSQRISIFLTGIFFLTASLFIYFIFAYFNVRLFDGNSFVQFMKIAGSLFVIFLLRILLTLLAGFVFKAESEFSFYSFHIFLFNKALGLGLIPVLLCLLYASALPQAVFMYAGILLFIVAYLARLIRGLNIGIARQGFNKFYLFFYFCTLEILPAVVLAKIILNHTV